MTATDRKQIHFIITGGTIDSYYDGTKDTVLPSATSIIPQFIQGLKLYTPPSKFTTVCMKDSRAITKSDQQKILKIIQRSANRYFIVTHGTYTMPDTARYLKAHLKSNQKTVILTGAMIPLAGFTLSDGSFNLGYSIASLRTLSPGVYVCMNGRVFDPAEVVKTLQEGRFSSILGEKR